MFDRRKRSESDSSSCWCELLEILTGESASKRTPGSGCSRKCDDFDDWWLEDYNIVTAASVTFLFSHFLLLLLQMCLMSDVRNQNLRNARVEWNTLDNKWE
jgi:hypothetical protein